MFHKHTHLWRTCARTLGNGFTHLQLTEARAALVSCRLVFQVDWKPSPHCKFARAGIHGNGPILEHLSHDDEHLPLQEVLRWTRRNSPFWGWLEGNLGAPQFIRLRLLGASHPPSGLPGVRIHLLVSSLRWRFCFRRMTSPSSALRCTLRLLRLAADTSRRAGRVVAEPLNVRRTDARRVPAAVSGLSRCAAGALLREAAGGRGDE